VHAYHLTEKTYSVTHTIMEDCKILVPVGTYASVSGQGFLIGKNTRSDKIAFWTLPVGIKVLSTCGTYVKRNKALRRILISCLAANFEIFAGTKIVFQKHIKTVLDENVTGLRLYIDHIL